MSTIGRGRAPDFAAQARPRTRSVSVPSRIQSVRSIGAPLSNTDCSPPHDAVARLNGAHRTPAADGSEYRSSGSGDSRSPMRLVPSVAPENTLRPSSASRADAAAIST